MKKPFYKRWWFVVFIVLALMGGVLSLFNEKVESEEPLKVEEKEVEPVEIEPIGEEEPKEIIPAREDSIGTSNKDYKELSKSNARKMRNDVTDKWMLSTFAESVDLNEYLISYNELHMEGSEVHVIVNFNYSTTTIVNDYGDRLSVRVHEYVKKEEHDAKSVGGGLLLGEYEIYKDNGDIIRID